MTEETRARCGRRLGKVVIVLLVAGVVVAAAFGLIFRYEPARTSKGSRRFFSRVLNPFVLWMSDRIGLEQSVLYHIGRKSGREYATPLCVSSTPDGFIAPVAFGPGVDWLANLKATPEARLVHEGATYPVVAEVIDSDEAVRYTGGSPGCPCWEEFGVELFALLRPSGD